MLAAGGPAAAAPRDVKLSTTGPSVARPRQRRLRRAAARGEARPAAVRHRQQAAGARGHPVNDTPSGATLRAAIHSLTVNGIHTALVNAKARGDYAHFNDAYNTGKEP